MNTLQWYILGALLLIVVLGGASLWYMSGTSKGPVADPEPTYSIVEKFGTYVVRSITTEYGESGVLSEKPEVYYELKGSWFTTSNEKRWAILGQYCDLPKAQEVLARTIEQDKERNKVRPKWEYKKDGSPYL